MKMILSTTQAANLLIADEYANWSRAGAYAMIEYFEEFENFTGDQLEFDPVAIRCDFTEYESLQSWMRQFWGDIGTAFDALGHYAEDGDDELVDKIREYIQQRGELIEFQGGIIVSSF